MDDIKYLKDIYNFHLYHVKSIGSTNTFLKENYNSFPDNSILLADIQTNGRGRYTRKWISNDDYTFSFLFKNNNYHNEILSPLAIVKALKKLDINGFIKWPNDVYYNNKKLSGILIESVYLGSNIAATIVGIGINKYDKPEVDGIGINKDISNINLVSLITEEYINLIKKDFKDIIDEYISFSNVINRYIEYQGEIYLAKNINDEGHLLIEKDNVIKEISTDEINLKIKIK